MLFIPSRFQNLPNLPSFTINLSSSLNLSAQLGMRCGVLIESLSNCHCHLISQAENYRCRLLSACNAISPIIFERKILLVWVFTLRHFKIEEENLI
jgi:hypothetical protein